MVCTYASREDLVNDPRYAAHVREMRDAELKQRKGPQVHKPDTERGYNVMLKEAARRNCL